MDFKQVETTPRPAEAVQWDGTRRHADEIIDWVRRTSPGIEVTYSEHYKAHDSDGWGQIEFHDTDQSAVTKDFWVLRRETGLKVEVVSDDDFKKTYRDYEGTRYEAREQARENVRRG